MPLIPSTLQQALSAAFKSHPDSPRVAAQKFAKAYADYAQTAMALSSRPLFTGLEAKLLEVTLYSAIANPKVGTPATLAAAWATGVASFWMAPPVVFTGGQVGAVLQAATVIPIITPGLTACFANLANTEDLAAMTMATILDAATRTVMVALAPPPGTTAPLL